jgi:hypothetical protein
VRRRPVGCSNGVALGGVRNRLAAGTAGGNGVYDLVHCAGDRVARVTVGTMTRDCRRVSSAGRGR